MTELSSLMTKSLSVGGILVTGSPAHATRPTKFDSLDVVHAVRVGSMLIGNQANDTASVIPAVDTLFLSVGGQPVDPRNYIFAGGQMVMDGDQPVVV